MFGKLGEAARQIQMMQRLMRDDRVKALLGHPKVRDLFSDPEFQAVVQSQDPAKIMGHPKLAALLRDPEVAPLLSQVDPNSFLAA